jgi:hypothetical protein
VTYNKVVYTHLVYDSNGQLIVEESYPYEGPWELAEGNPSEVEPASAPDPSGLDIMDFDDGDSDAPLAEEPATEEPEAEEETPSEGEKETFKTPEQVLAEAEAAKKAAPAKGRKGKAAEEKPKEVDTKPAEEPKPAEVQVKPPEPAPAAEPPAELKSPEQMRSELATEIAGRYPLTFSEEEQEQLRLDPAPVLSAKLPGIVGRLYVDVYEAIMYATFNQLPKIISGIQHVETTSREKMSRFYEAYPDLNKPEYAQKLADIGKFYRGMNPKATEDEAIKGVGDTAMAFFGLQRAPAPVEAQPAATPAPKPKMPAVPAGARTGAGQITAPQADNPIVDLLDYEFPDS